MACMLVGCAGSLPKSLVDRVSGTTESVGIDSDESISDFWLRKYNIAAQSELARVWRYGQRVGWKRRYEKILKAVLKYDQNNADYFATEVSLPGSQRFFETTALSSTGATRTIVTVIFSGNWVKITSWTRIFARY